MFYPQSISALALAVALGLSTTAFAADHGKNESDKGMKNSVPEMVTDTDQIIVRFKDSASTTGIDRVLTQLSAQQVDKVRHLRTTEQKSEVFKWERRKNRDQLKAMTEWLKSQPEVEYAEPDMIMTAMALPNDTYLSYQWPLLDANVGIRAEKAWDVSTGQGVTVGVIDTGFRPHVDLAANLLAGYDMISSSTVAVDGDGRDADASDPGSYNLAGECGIDSPARNSSWHGTHVAGTIAAVTNNSTGIAGVAYNSKVVPVRVLGKCGGYSSDIADSILWAAGNAVTGTTLNKNPARVLNLSLGGAGACGITTQNAIDAARAKGTVVVVSAGNSNLDAGTVSPASCNGVITVAATGRDGGKAYYSNYGAVVDIAAPGGAMGNSTDGVLSTLNTGTTTPDLDTYAYYQGTSMAAPHVAGVAALMLSANPYMTPDQVESVIKSTARAFPATCTSCGAGLMDAEAAVNQALALKPADPYALVKTDLATNKALWTNSKVLNYSYVLDQQVGTSLQRFKFTIKSGVVVAGVNLANNRSLASKDLKAKGKTMEQLFGLVDQALAAKYADIKASYAATLGYPLTINLDPSLTVTGDQSSYKVSSFTAL